MKPLTRAGQTDRFVHDRLPHPAHQPTFLLPSHLQGSFPLNCVQRLLLDQITAGHGDRIAVRSTLVTWTYSELADRAGRIASMLQQDYGLVSGERILLRAANSPWLVAFWLAAQLCGAIPVTTLSLLRRRELETILEIAQPRLCVCEEALVMELSGALQAGGQSGGVVQTIGFGGDSQSDLDAALLRFKPLSDPANVLSDDIALIGFTSGTTGRPKATVHLHRDVIAVCEIVAEGVLGAGPEDVFIGTAPLAFTFGLGGFLLFPLFVGGQSVLNERYTPESLLDEIGRTGATICFTVPTFYQRMARLEAAPKTRSLRLAVCSGEALPRQVRDDWESASGIALTEFLGATEMLHAFIGCRPEQRCGDAVGRCFEGYEAVILDSDGQPVANGTPGRLAVRGPSGCRYLDDDRQSSYVQDGWNITGDTCHMDSEGNVWFHARSDDMIISSGYNISGIEVEEALLGHPAVAECAVVGEADTDRGERVAAWVVKNEGAQSESELVSELQHHVQSVIAPYKYPRVIRFIAALPRSESGKIQRFRLRAE